jgi:hypothetical protein
MRRGSPPLLSVTHSASAVPAAAVFVYIFMRVYKCASRISFCPNSTMLSCSGIQVSRFERVWRHALHAALEELMLQQQAMRARITHGANFLVKSHDVTLLIDRRTVDGGQCVWLFSDQ